MQNSKNLITQEKFINDWNGSFPNYPLAPGDLKIAHKVVGALFSVFDRLDIDRDVVTQPPQEENHNEHLVYYWDLLTIVNVTRIVNHLLSFLSHMVKISILVFLQPTPTTSQSILLYNYNLCLFYEQRFKEIKPLEDELLLRSNQVKILEDKKNKLVELLNEQAVEKGKRAERLEKIEYGQKQQEEELKQEKEAHDEERQKFDSIVKENKQIELMLEKKRAFLDGLIDEVEKKRALRVYDADDINAKVELAVSAVQEAEERLNSLKSLLMEKEDNLKYLSAIIPNLTTANNLLNVLAKLSNYLKDFDNFEFDHAEGKMRMFHTEISDFKANYEEVKTAKAQAVKRRQEGQAEREREKKMLQMALKEAEQEQKEHLEKTLKWRKQVQKIKELTEKYKAEKAAGEEEVDSITNDLKKNLKLTEEELLKRTLDTKKRVEELRKRGGRSF